MVDAKNLSTHPGSPSGPGEYVGVIAVKSLKRELSLINEVKVKFALFKGLV